MAGHSQFKNIMHRKGAQDAKRGKMFTKIGREIIAACKGGAPDPATNPRLRSAIQWAREENMPRDKIEQAIKRASDNFEPVRYEAYGPGGTALIVQALTDNRNRTASDVRAAFSKLGGALGETGSVSFMFDFVGRITYPFSIATEDRMFEAALEAGADNCETGPEEHSVICAADAFGAVRDSLEAIFGHPTSAKLTWIPKTSAPLDEEQARALLKLIDTLEDHDDVQEVFSNAEIPQDVMDKLG